MAAQADLVEIVHTPGRPRAPHAGLNLTRSHLISMCRQPDGKARELIMAKNTRHVIASISGGWSVRKQGASRASKNFSLQEEAVKYGQELARKDHSDLFVHGRNGLVSDHTSYEK